uniref:Uncharacterized protein n=1 Tax=Arundo donax TaxID=35708 RepID=A0A0A9G5P2_ARUDO
MKRSFTWAKEKFQISYQGTKIDHLSCEIEGKIPTDQTLFSQSEELTKDAAANFRLNYKQTNNYRPQRTNGTI